MLTTTNLPWCTPAPNSCSWSTSSGGYWPETKSSTNHWYICVLILVNMACMTILAQQSILFIWLESIIFSLFKIFKNWSSPSFQGVRRHSQFHHILQIDTGLAAFARNGISPDLTTVEHTTSCSYDPSTRCIDSVNGLRGLDWMDGDFWLLLSEVKIQTFLLPESEST